MLINKFYRKKRERIRFAYMGPFGSPTLILSTKEMDKFPLEIFSRKTKKRQRESLAFSGPFGALALIFTA